MPLYKYQALTETGKKIAGVIDADSLGDAKIKLRNDQVLVTDLFLFEKKKKESRLPIPFLIDFTQMLGQLLSAGIPLYDSLVIIEEKYHHHKFQPLLID